MVEELKIREEDDGHTSILRLKGKVALPVGSTERMRDRLLACCDVVNERVVVDFAECKHVDSAGVVERAQGLVRLEHLGRQIQLVNLGRLRNDSIFNRYVIKRFSEPTPGPSGTSGGGSL